MFSGSVKDVRLFVNHRMGIPRAAVENAGKKREPWDVGLVGRTDSRDDQRW